jgi:hypothetical protein
MTEEVSILVAPQIMHDELEQSVPDFFAALQVVCVKLSGRVRD